MSIGEIRAKVKVALGRPFASVLEPRPEGWSYRFDPAGWEWLKANLSDSVGDGLVAPLEGASRYVSRRQDRGQDLGGGGDARPQGERRTAAPSTYRAYYSADPDVFGPEDVRCPRKGPTPAELVAAFSEVGQPSVTLFRNGGLISLRVPDPVKAALPAPQVQRSGTCIRGDVEGFSPASQLRFRRLFASIDREVIPAGRVMMAVLTYPGVWERNRPEQWKQDLDNWHKRILRAWGELPVLWKLEFQPKRGAPHFHLLVLMPPEMEGRQKEFLRWARRAWWEVVGSGDKWHLRYGFWMAPAHSWDSASSYVAKYISKPCAAPIDWNTGEIQGVGRWWGVWHKDKLPITQEVSKLTLSQAKASARVLKRLAVSRCKSRLRKAISLQNTGELGAARKAVASAKRALRRAKRNSHSTVTQFLNYPAALKLLAWARLSTPGLEWRLA